MPGGDAAQAGQGVPAKASASAVKVLWPAVTGAQLEELLHGLLEAMGASSLIWRAGSAAGVTASDGGRDLEAVFNRLSPDDELDRQRWWVECKGRSETVERSAVQQAVLDASARVDVDVLVVATNSRFSNPTRDWVEERSRSYGRPVIKLWDRDHLDRLVRKYPTVAARVLPQALPDEERLRLLIARFKEIGEEPTQLDLDYFWEHRDWLIEQESHLKAEATAVFLYAEGVSPPHVRHWWRLLSEDDVPEALIEGLLNLPSLLHEDSLPRPVELIRVLASAGRIVVACLIVAPQSATSIALNPWKIVVDGEDIADDEEELKQWQTTILRLVLAFIQSDLVEACSRDCPRVSAENPHEHKSLSQTGFWQALFEGAVEESIGDLVDERMNAPCTVGLSMDAGCPLIVSNERDCERHVQEINEVLQFRKTRRESAASTLHSADRGPFVITMLKDQGLSYWIYDSRREAESGTSQASDSD